MSDLSRNGNTDIPGAVNVNRCWPLVAVLCYCSASATASSVAQIDISQALLISNTLKLLFMLLH